MRVACHNPEAAGAANAGMAGMAGMADLALAKLMSDDDVGPDLPELLMAFRWVGDRKAS